MDQIFKAPQIEFKKTLAKTLISSVFLKDWFNDKDPLLVHW